MYASFPQRKGTGMELARAYIAGARRNPRKSLKLPDIKLELRHQIAHSCFLEAAGSQLESGGAVGKDVWSPLRLVARFEPLSCPGAAPYVVNLAGENSSNHQLLLSCAAHPARAGILGYSSSQYLGRRAKAGLQGLHQLSATAALLKPGHWQLLQHVEHTLDFFLGRSAISYGRLGIGIFFPLGQLGQCAQPGDRRFNLVVEAVP